MTVIPSAFVAIPSRTEGRLTAVSGDPAPGGIGVISRTLYYTPFIGNHISLWTGEAWQDFTFEELSISMDGLADITAYDVYGFLDPDAGPTLELSSAWPALDTIPDRDLKDGVLVKGGDPTRKLLGSIGIAAGGDVPGGFSYCVDLINARLISNLYNTLPRPMMTCAGYVDGDGETLTTLSDPSEVWLAPLWGPGIPNYNNWTACTPRQMLIHADVLMRNNGSTIYGAGILTAFGDENYDTSKVKVSKVTTLDELSAHIVHHENIATGFSVAVIAFVAKGGAKSVKIVHDTDRFGALIDPFATKITSTIMN